MVREPRGRAKCDGLTKYRPPPILNLMNAQSFHFCRTTTTTADGESSMFARI